MKVSRPLKVLIYGVIIACLGFVVFFMLIWMNTSLRSECPSRPVVADVKKADESELVFYVDANNGNDNWNGTLIDPYKNINGPFKTLKGAVRGARRHRKSVDKKATIYLLGGTHYVNDVITMSQRDSDLSIAGYPGEDRPVITGSEKISGRKFTPIDQKIWAAPIKGGCSKHVFLGDKRLIRARKPNLKFWNGDNLGGEGPYLTIKNLLSPTPQCNRKGAGGYKQTNCPFENTNGFEYSFGDIDSDWIPLQNGNPAEILVFAAWTAERGKIEQITKDKVYFQEPLRFEIGHHPVSSGWRYIAENIRAELDAVGEFFCDESTKMLYVIPPDGAFDTEDVYISQTPTFFSVSGAKNINFIDLEFRHSHDSDFDGYNYRLGLLSFDNCENVLVYLCEFIHIGYIAVLFEDVINSKVLENRFDDIGYIAITMLYSNGKPSYVFSNRNITTEKNTLRRCGVTNMHQPACMLIQGVSDIIVRANDISYSSYAGIRVGWQPTFNNSYLRQGEKIFLIERNHVHNYGNGILSDFAGIYLSSNSICGTTETSLDECNLYATIRENIIYNSTAYKYGAMGVYGDTGVSSLTVTNNWVYNLSGTAINFHCGQNNKATNNMIFHTANDRVFGTCKSIGPRSIPRQNLTFSRNVIYVANERARMYGFEDLWSNDVPIVHDNVYYFKPFSQRSFDRFFPKRRSWARWRNATGNDKNSMIKDPMYHDIRFHDFRLRENSPALKLGITSVDLTKVIKESGSCPPVDV